MLTSDFRVAEEGITVPYPPLFDQTRHNYGFVDLRGHPELVTNIPEGSQSAALRALLVRLSEPGSPFFSLGCDLGAHEESENDETSRHVAGGYVQVIRTPYADRSPDDYLTYGQAITEALTLKAENYNWFVRLELNFVVFELDNFSKLVPSLLIWFYARSRTPQSALTSREVLIGDLCTVLCDKCPDL